MGVPWLGWTCGACRYCRSGNENLCDRARFTGYDLDGGYAEEAVADERFCFPLPDSYPDAHAAPLLCAGLIGYRLLLRAGDAERIGLYGFGAAAHIVAQIAQSQGRRVWRGLHLTPAVSLVTASRSCSSSAWLRKDAVLGSASATAVNSVLKRGRPIFCVGGSLG